MLYVQVVVRHAQSFLPFMMKIFSCVLILVLLTRSLASFCPNCGNLCPDGVSFCSGSEPVCLNNYFGGCEPQKTSTITYFFPTTTSTQYVSTVSQGSTTTQLIYTTTTDFVTSTTTETSTQVCPIYSFIGLRVVLES